MHSRIILILLFLLPLAGCPQMLVKQVEELRPPKNYKPIYQMSEKSIDSVLKSLPFSTQNAQAIDSLLLSLESRSSMQDFMFALPNSAISSSLIGIDDASYPDSIHVKLSIKD